MGAAWLKKQLKEKDIVEKVHYEDNNLCVVYLSGTSDQIPKILRVYIPLNSERGEDYLVDQEVISRAINRNATHLVYEMWISGVTLAAEEYARRNNISIYTVGEFLSKIDKGIHP
jgi:hypothetical protein